LTTRFRILYFAQARSAVGIQSEEMVLDHSPSVSFVLEEVFRLHPSLRKLQEGLRVAINEEVVPETEIVKDKDRVAFLPMVVGG